MRTTGMRTTGVRTISASGALKPQRLTQGWGIYEILKHQVVAIIRFSKHHNHKQWANRKPHLQHATGTLSTSLEPALISGLVPVKNV